MPDDDYTYEIPGRPGAAAALYTQCESCYASCFAHTFNDHVVQLGCWDICCAERAASGLEVGSVSVGSAIGGASFIAGGATSTVAGYIPGASAVRPLQRDPSSPPAPPTYEPHRRRAGGWSRGDGRLAHVAHPKHAAVPGPAGGNLPLLPDGVHLFLHGGRLERLLGPLLHRSAVAAAAALAAAGGAAASANASSAALPAVAALCTRH